MISSAARKPQRRFVTDAKISWRDAYDNGGLVVSDLRFGDKAYESEISGSGGKGACYVGQLRFVLPPCAVPVANEHRTRDPRPGRTQN